MYKKLMVPLDGSPTAEMTLPYAIELSARFDSEITLFSVTETTSTEGLYRSYLNSVSENLVSAVQARGIANPKISTQISAGNPATEILRGIQFNNIDLVIIASRGSSVEDSWSLGNIAAKIVRIADKPVILVKQPIKEVASHDVSISKILVPLDGSHVGEAAIPHAEALAQKFGSRLILFHAIEPAPWPMTKNVTNKARDEKEFQTASNYLEAVATDMKRRGLLVTSQMEIGYPADEIIKYAETSAVDLIAISTHGRSGVGRWAIGSVTDKLLNAGTIPILVEHSTMS